MASRVFPMLSAEDFEASLRFYRDLLGGEVTYGWPEDDPVYVSLTFGESSIGVGRMSGAPIHGLPQRPATGHRVELCVYVDDVDAIAAAAGTIVFAPQDMPWGERIAYVEDPDGNLVMLTKGV